MDSFGGLVVASEGDCVLVKVVNHVQKNVTFHWYVPLSPSCVIRTHQVRWPNINDPVPPNRRLEPTFTTSPSSIKGALSSAGMLTSHGNEPPSIYGTHWHPPKGPCRSLIHSSNPARKCLSSLGMIT
ncbi:hypothetical protein CKAN_01499300 [Cinnamomum micranthum f. kanehirae]|uniref:Uncharacterized protein n=1 Tax=Cinnamomum micranthum f. kanehirae TaxID=337451 RepID=A0A443P5Q0_9MAGN|nr:hypothetical protein CKAN_01499300 [Cinnamomum micranthum f. kanehirae]